MAAGATTLPFVTMGCSNAKNVASPGIGVQIYSVRNELQQDMEGTLQALSIIGFDYIEAFGLGTDGLFFGQYTPTQFRTMVENTGMTVRSTHCNYFTPHQAPVMVNAAKELGVDMLIIPYLTEDQRSGYEKHAEDLTAIGEAFNKEGIGFGYHNHEFEFFVQEDGSIPMRTLLENTNPEFVSFQADLYWFTKAGQNPMEWIEEFPGRFNSYHIKDANSNLDQTTVGTGIIDFQKILNENKKAGVQFVFVEDERTDQPLENVKEAYEHLSGLSFKL